MSSGTTARLDAFTDAAFAFAVTLLVIGGNEAAYTYSGLAAAVADVPTFAIGFAIIAMFWFAHVRWRNYRGPGDWLSVLLSVLLVFLILVYVQPLRAMARSFSSYLGGAGQPFVGDVGDLFVIYGAGFVAMSATMAGLFAEALRETGLNRESRASLRGELAVQVIMASTGLASVALACFETTERLAPWVYATLGVTLGLFSALYDWRGRKAAARPTVK